VRKAFYLAKLESRPIMLSAPMDIQQQEFEDDEPYRPSSTLMPRAPCARIPQSRTGGRHDRRQPQAHDHRRPRRPWSGAGNAVLKLAERAGALIATTLMAKTWLSEDEFHIGISGTYGTRTAMQLCEEADCVIAIGASLNRFTTEHNYLYPNAKFVHIDAKPHVMMSGGRAAECYLQSDARAGVEALEALLAKRGFKQTGYRTGEVRERLANAWDDRRKYTIEPGSVDPREVILALDEAVPANINLFTGSGATAGFSNIGFRRQRPLVLPSHFFGCIGQMMPAAMGGVTALGNQPAILVDGDASVMMHLAEFDTMVRYEMPLLIVVMNNQMLGAEYYKLDAHKMNAALSCIATPDLGAVATGFGGRGRLVRSIPELRTAVAEWLAKPGPMMIDVRIATNVITLPYRRIHYGLDE